MLVRREVGKHGRTIVRAVRCYDCEKLAAAEAAAWEKAEAEVRAALAGGPVLSEQSLTDLVRLWRAKSGENFPDILWRLRRDIREDLLRTWWRRVGGSGDLVCPHCKYEFGEETSGFSGGIFPERFEHVECSDPEGHKAALKAALDEAEAWASAVKKLFLSKEEG